MITQARGAPFAYPADGSILRIGKATQTAIGLELRDVSLLGDRVPADRLGVPSRRLAGAVVDGLRVDERAEAGTANAILSLGGSSYLVVF